MSQLVSLMPRPSAGSNYDSELLDSVTKPSSQVISFGTAAVTLITDFELNFTLDEAQVVEIGYNIMTYKGVGLTANRVLFYELDYDGISDRVWTLIALNAINYALQWTGAIHAALAAGAHTVEFGAMCETTNVSILSTDTLVWTWYPVSTAWAKTVLLQN